MASKDKRIKMNERSLSDVSLVKGIFKALSVVKLKMKQSNDENQNRNWGDAQMEKEMMEHIILVFR